MVVKLHLLAAACVLALALVSEANGSCHTVKLGRQIGKPIKLRKIHLPPHKKDVEVKIPSDCGNFKGLVGKVCDFGLPKLEFTDTHTIVIHRKGDTDKEGTADFTVYCYPVESEVPSKLAAVAQPVALK